MYRIMGKLRFRITLLSVIFSCAIGLSQQSKLERALRKYDKLAYIDAREIFIALVNKGQESAEILEKIGDSYYFNGKYGSASKWYAKLVENHKDSVQPEYYFKYAQSLRALQEYDEADKIMATFNDIKGYDSRAKRFVEKPDYVDLGSYKESKYKLQVIRILNSRYSDFGPTVIDDKLIFASSRDTGIVAKRIHKWNNQPFLNLYVSSIKGGGEYTRPVPFNDKLNSKFHESTTTLSLDGQVLYFTRNNFTPGNFGKSKKGTNKLKIYRSTKRAGGWTDPEELPFNSSEYSCAHPVLSPDQSKLYFSSDMEGTTGLSDIWVVDILEDGKFGKPENMGPRINTEGRETFPFISKKGNLYFASDGHPGLGGLDLFVTKPYDDKAIIHNLGEPINSSKDDFGFTVDDNTLRGFLSSNRKTGALGSDDIFGFVQEELPEPTCDVALTGVITDKETGELLPEAIVQLYNEENDLLEEVEVDENAVYKFSLTCQEGYIVRAVEPRYFGEERIVNAPNKDKVTLQEDMALERRLTEIQVGDDLAELLNLSPIYFDYDKYNIRPDAAIELARVISVMKRIPTLVISARSHTDSRGHDSYNLKLSDNRAKSTVEYIISQGIESSSISGEGYGETQLVNKCSNGVKCSDEEHQLNRRSEFIVLAK